MRSTSLYQASNWPSMAHSTFDEMLHRTIPDLRWRYAEVIMQSNVQVMKQTKQHDQELADLLEILISNCRILLQNHTADSSVSLATRLETTESLTSISGDEAMLTVRLQHLNQ